MWKLPTYVYHLYLFAQKTFDFLVKYTKKINVTYANISLAVNGLK